MNDVRDVTPGDLGAKKMTNSSTFAWRCPRDLKGSKTHDQSISIVKYSFLYVNEGVDMDLQYH